MSSARIEQVYVSTPVHPALHSAAVPAAPSKSCAGRARAETPRSGDAERSGIRKTTGPVSIGAFRILISPSRLAHELGETLGRAGCLVQDGGEGVLVVQAAAPTREQAERELRLYVASWLALNEGAEVEVDPEPEPD
jgi:hypothetical protein